MSIQIAVISVKWCAVDCSIARYTKFETLGQFVEIWTEDYGFRGCGNYMYVT